MLLLYDPICLSPPTLRQPQVRVSLMAAPWNWQGFRFLLKDTSAERNLTERFVSKWKVLHPPTPEPVSHKRFVSIIYSPMSNKSKRNTRAGLSHPAESGEKREGQPQKSSDPYQFDRGAPVQVRPLGLPPHRVRKKPGANILLSDILQHPLRSWIPSLISCSGSTTLSANAINMRWTSLYFIIIASDCRSPRFKRTVTDISWEITENNSVVKLSDVAWC